MIQITRWSPDTCECVIEYKWDDSLPVEQRVHDVHDVIVKCPAHAATLTHQEHFNTVLDENQRKNYFHGEIIKNHPELTVKDAQGNDQLKDGVYEWSFDANRVLKAKVNGLDPAKKNALKGIANGKFGVGKVEVS